MVVIPAPGADRMRQQSLLRAIRNGQRWMEMLINGEAKNITDLAAGEILPLFLRLRTACRGGYCFLLVPPAITRIIK